MLASYYKYSSWWGKVNLIRIVFFLDPVGHIRCVLVRYVRMLVQCEMPELTSDAAPIKTYNINCKPPTSKCNCKDCENCLELKTVLKMWLSNNGYRLIMETLTNPTREFSNDLFESLPKVWRHLFIATQQSTFLRHLKENEAQNECVAVCDKAENYSFILQDAMEQCSSNNTFICYLSLVVISDCMAHDTDVHLFQRLSYQPCMQDSSL